MKLGIKIFKELSRRNELGMYFDYSGYRSLRFVSDIDSLSSFMEKRGYVNVPRTEDEVEITDWLKKQHSMRECNSVLTWVAFDPLGGILGLPLWLIYRIVFWPR